MPPVYRNGRRTIEEAKERRRLQTRLAQRRYRGKKKSEAQAGGANDVDAKVSSIFNQTIEFAKVSSSVEGLQENTVDGSLTRIGNGYLDIMKDLFNSPDFAFLTPSSSSISPANESSSSDFSSGKTSLASFQNDFLPDSKLPSIIDAARKNGYVGVALAKHQKANLREFLAGNLSVLISNQMLRQGESVFLPKIDLHRAFFANAFALSFLPSDLEKCRMQSRITDIWKNRSPLLSVPENMVPVEEQFTISHNIFVDVLPWPSVRQKALKAIEAGVLDMDTFKQDGFFGCNEDRGYQTAFQVHGASAADDYFFNSTGAADLTMDAESWQCSQTWLEKYWFLVDAKIVRRTNWWRRMQGLIPVKIPTFSEQQSPVRLVEMVA